MASPEDHLPDAPVSDRALIVLLIVTGGAFALMLVWLVGR